ncbi:Sugar kinase of the NBD/HSP70 family, may contain an N-terminal HTH domain [Cohaesibacter sp. ES.047]|uniref:ROK family transcriptional regulator n=1 Tax=Cohaesibacter sp. ES.047 TaxID=1798205 RepID=UPI000BC06708|nr:ROK family transcriptional regulator [Cohaesibacter sp. ES.047]SNY91660.1 Sugar kinase of the NBD/HSP70 family, may contain an N-terminal HTH domain [Cohaesibacter sp. ES.047]
MQSDAGIDAACSLSQSERKIMSTIKHSGPMARSEITRETELAQQTVHRIVDSLEQRGYLKFGEAVIAGRGKPSPTVSIHPDNFASIGLSISTDHVRLCLLDLSGNPLAQETELLAASNPEQAVNLVRQKMDAWHKQGIGNRSIVGIGISMQGFRTGPNDQFQPPELLSTWQSLPLEAYFGSALDLPAFAENNSTASAVAEYYLGAGSDCDTLAYLSFNHGFGAGIYSGNRPFLGGNGNAGEIGALFLSDELNRRPALSELLRALNAKGHALNGVMDLTSRFDAEWPAVADWLEAVKPQLQLALRALQATVDPQAIFFGGEAPDDLRHMLMETSVGAFRDKRLPRPALIVSALQGDPAHLGAGLLPLRELVF